MVGKPLSCDEPTISCSRLDYARLCIELNASLPFIHQFEIESPLSDEPQLVKVDYEWKPPRCERCQCFGHNCVAKEEQLMKLTQKEDKRPAEQTPSEVKESTNMGNGDQETKPGKMGQINEVVDATSITPQASTSLKQSIDPCRQDKPNGKAPQASQEASSGSGNVASEIHEKGNWLPRRKRSCPRKKGKLLLLPSLPASIPLRSSRRRKGGKRNMRPEASKVQQWATKNRLNLMGIMEPRVMIPNIAVVEEGLGMRDWTFFSNVYHGPLCRIMIGWNSNVLEVTILSSSGQWVTCDTKRKDGGQVIRVTFVYGSSTSVERQELWHYLKYQKSINDSVPWLVTGDFNAIMRVTDRQGGDSNWYRHMEDFPNCALESELIHLAAEGHHFTWHNRQQGTASILRKLDWAFGNQNLIRLWPQAKATFQARIESDHNPILITLSPKPPYQRARFKFLNLWTDLDGYEETVRASWGIEAQGNPFSRLTTKLRTLKGYLNNFHKRNSSHISSRVVQAERKWKEAQDFLDQHPQDLEAGKRERDMGNLYSALRKAEESFFKQRSRVNWLQLGDRNTSFFHRSLLHRRHRNGITSLCRDSGEVIRNPEEIDPY
ncbi:hypothetical protein OIU84_025946 [Salix udensis]|uniref:Endonuclease/exonuclease/phosphatase domain-containing protein n=1 Tax=Salix udensis TaxID=889485 RepID=A0AAD6PDQ1_9ROSI|nr:hypothetical protein OIU84_025946 [Salix udensis]